MVNNYVFAQIEIWKVKKLIKRLEAARGNGTSMISLIIRTLKFPSIHRIFSYFLPSGFLLPLYRAVDGFSRLSGRGCSLRRRTPPKPRDVGWQGLFQDRVC